MLKQFSLTELVKAVKAKIETNTDMKCYDIVPVNAVSPFSYVQVVNVEPADTKTMYCKNYTIWVHVVADSVKSSVPLYKLIEDVEEAMTEDILIPSPYVLVMQTDDGLQTIQDEDTGEKHGIISFTFKISYGFKIK